MPSRPHKILKRILLAVAVVLAVVVIAASVGLMLFRGTPDWYRPLTLAPEAREAAAQSATNKLAVIQNEAARLRRDELLADRASSATRPSGAPARQQAITISFTEDELNAFFDKWAVWNGWKDKYQQYVSDPVILLDDGRLIIAGQVKELNTVASLHFQPVVTRDGELDLRLVRVLGGRLPLPEAIFSGYRQKLRGSVMQRLPYWRRTARMDAIGTPNLSAVAAAMGTLAIRMLNHEPADATLFVPIVDQQLRARSMPVRLTEVSVENRTLTLTVEPMTAEQRAALLRRIREGQP